eukprot:SAG22_NODE_201_length_15391_cov_7.662176_14_plen_433_part_00
MPPAPAAAAEPATITAPQRMLSACSGALATSLLMTPLDVVKTRLQAQAPGPELKCTGAEVLKHRNIQRAFSTAAADGGGGCAKCSHYYTLNNGLMEHAVATRRPARLACDVPHFAGTVDAMRKIARHEGVLSLYNGLPPTLVMAVPSTVLYFTAYDAIKGQLQELLPGVGSSGLAPPLAGASARLLAATAVTPLELVRTQMMAERGGGATSVTDVVLDRMRRNVVRHGVKVLYRGLAPTLARDVPFSAIYWLGYEQIKQALIARQPPPPPPPPLSAATATAAAAEPTSLQTIFFRSFVAGAGSGALAATLTTPFDVVKTRQQLLRDRSSEAVAAPAPGAGAAAAATGRAAGSGAGSRRPAVPGTMAVMRQVVAEAGPRGLFAGLGPRLAKVSPACAIMIASFEFGKVFFDRLNSANQAAAAGAERNNLKVVS